VLLAAGLDGMEKGYELPSAVEENVFEMSTHKRKELGIKTLPDSLYEAIKLAQDSPLLKEALGEHVFNTFMQNKNVEWERFCAQVTDYELKRYLPIL
jgi:glutamine synthetase